MKRNDRTLLIFFALYVAAGGVHYFIAGRDGVNSLTSNLLVGLQIAAGLAVAFWLWRKPKS